MGGFKTDIDIAQQEKNGALVKPDSISTFIFPVPEEVLEAGRAIAQRMHVAMPEVRIATRNLDKSVAGLPIYTIEDKGRTVMVFSAAAIRELTPEDLKCGEAHELAHLHQEKKKDSAENKPDRASKKQAELDADAIGAGKLGVNDPEAMVTALQHIYALAKKEIGASLNITPETAEYRMNHGNYPTLDERTEPLHRQAEKSKHFGKFPSR